MTDTVTAPANPGAGTRSRPPGRWKRIALALAFLAPALVVLGAFLALIWRMWNQFRQRTITPAAKRVSAAVDNVDARADAAMDRVGQEFTEAREGFTGWLDTWRGKPRQ